MKSIKKCAGRSAVSSSILISVFPLLVSVLVDIASSRVGLKICAITTEIKKYNSTQLSRRRGKDMIK